MRKMTMIATTTADEAPMMAGIGVSSGQHKNIQKSATSS
jgi:hypothetical protein